MSAIYDITGVYADDPDLRAVAVGLDAEHFVENTKLGKFLINRAHECRISALEQLTLVDATDANAIIRLQWASRTPDLFLQWLDEAIALGRSAEESIREEDYGH